MQSVLPPRALVMLSGFAASRASRYKQHVEPPDAVLKPVACEGAEGREWLDTAKGYVDIYSSHYH